MNILYISPRFPYPPDQGDKVVIYNHLKFLSRTNRITLLSLFRDEKELDGISQLSAFCSRIEVCKQRANFSLRNLVSAACRTEPFTAIRYYSPSMFKKARQFIESGRFDIIHAAFYYMGRYAVDKKISIPKKTAAVLDTHNIEYLVYSRFARLAKNPVKKALVCLEAFRIKKYEIPIYAKFDKCIAFSQLDKENITGLSGASNIVVNPSCIEPAYGGEGPPSHEEKNTIIFFGLLNTPANDDAVRFFCRRIFPEVRKRIPDAKFLIAGKYPSGYVVRLTRDPAIKVLGLISDMKGLLERAALVVVPLRLGGGIRIKILEAWACGKAVVSTAVGAEGVEVADGKDIVIADSPIDFANKVVELLGDDAKRKELGQAALKKVREYYTPERIVKNLETIYKQALAEKTAK